MDRALDEIVAERQVSSRDNLEAFSLALNASSIGKDNQLTCRREAVVARVVDAAADPDKDENALNTLVTA